MKHETTRMRLDALTAAPYNPREISDEALAGLKESLSRFGLVQPIVWNKRSGHVVGGHQRAIGLRELGETEAEVIVVDLEERDEKALNLSLNNPAIAGTFTTALGPLLGEMKRALPEFAALRLPEMKAADPEAGAGGGRGRGARAAESRRDEAGGSMDAWGASAVVRGRDEVCVDGRRCRDRPALWDRFQVREPRRCA